MDYQRRSSYFRGMFALLLAGADPVAVCSAAVHRLGSASREEIRSACAAPPADLWGGAPDCSAALSNGRAAADAGNLPEDMRAGVIRAFDAKVAACQVAKPSGGRKTEPRLWD